MPGTVEVRGGRGVRFRARGRGARRGDEEPVQVVHDAESGIGGGGVRREHVRVDDSDGFSSRCREEGEVGDEFVERV